MTGTSAEANKKALAIFERALELPLSERHNFIISQVEPNSEVGQIALALLARDEAEDSGLITGGAFQDASSDTVIPDAIGAYKIIEQIGRGGMGAVYKGARISGDFEHDVAIKVIRKGALSQRLVERFESERQTLAKMSHPNIARLYDGGTLDDGAPYIVMEFIDGLPIGEWLEQTPSDLSTILALFKDTCKAVGYAHQNLIIHRDITPSNVLVDKTGQVKLIDFGIAKPVDELLAENEANHSLASMSFTPGFAAPERLQGLSANTLSDIYSLGQLLDKLLGENNKDKELQAIIAKASAEAPDDRYNTVEALIDEIDNYISDFPVDAYAGGKRYRLSKFFTRHKVGFVFTSASFATLLVAFFLTFLQYQRAEAARVDASKRFNDVRSLASTMMNDIYDKLYRVPGTTDASIELIKAAQKYLDELAAETTAPDDVKLEAAIGYTKLGTMVAGAKIGSYTDLDAADGHFEKAENILLALQKNNTTDAQVLTSLGKLYFHMAEISILPRRQTELAMQQLEQSKAALEQAVELDIENLKPKLALLHSTCYMGEILITQNKTEEAKQVLRSCIQNGAKLDQQFPNNSDILRAKSAFGRTLANALSIEGKYTEAIEVLNQSIIDLEEVKSLLNADNDSFTLRALTIAYWRRGYAHTNTEKYEEALDDYTKALLHTNTRLTKDPQDKDATWFYYTITAEQATAMAKLGKNEEAENALLTTLNWYESRHQEKPDDPSRLGNLFIHHYMMADFYKNIPSPEKQCSNYKKAYEYFQLIEQSGTLTNLDKQNLQALKTDAANCDIDFE